MRRICVCFGLCVVLLCASIAQAAAPTLRSAGYVRQYGSTMDVGYYSAPEVLDWNEDGKKDLLVGKFYYGDAVLFINRATDEAPGFTSGSLIRVGGSDLNVGYT